MSFVRSVVVVFVFVGVVVYVMMSRSYEGSYPRSRSNLRSIANVISGRKRTWSRQCGQMSMRRKHGPHEAGGEQAKWSKGRWTNSD